MWWEDHCDLTDEVKVVFTWVGHLTDIQSPWKYVEVTGRDILKLEAESLFILELPMLPKAIHCWLAQEDTWVT